MNFHEGLLLVTWKFSLSFSPCFEAYLLKLEICGTINPWLLLHKHQWSTRWAFARKHGNFTVKRARYFTRENNVMFTVENNVILFSLWKEHHCYGYIIPFNKKRLDVLLHDQNIIVSFSEIFGYLRKYSQSSEIFQNCSERLSGFGQLLLNLRKSSKSDRKASENRRHKDVRIICSVVRYQVKHWKRNSISTRTIVFSSILSGLAVLHVLALWNVVLIALKPGTRL